MTVCFNNYFVVISDITSILKETPNERVLFQLLIGISDKWYDIGLSLQVHRNILDDLKQSEGNSGTKLINILKVIQPSSVTWETVITNMESPIVNDKKTADLIRQYLSTSESNKLLLLSNEVINSGVQTTSVMFIQLSSNQHCLHTIHQLNVIEKLN